jgi:hypothetical protein
MRGQKKSEKIIVTFAAVFRLYSQAGGTKGKPVQKISADWLTNRRFRGSSMERGIVKPCGSQCKFSNLNARKISGESVRGFKLAGAAPVCGNSRL